MGRRWTPLAAEGQPDGLILFDGVCVFCSRWVRFVLERDRDFRFRFVAIQSEAGRALAERFGISPDQPETNAVIHGGRIWFKSDAALVVLGGIGPMQPLARLARRMPRVLRDPLYDLIARNRYRIFGRTEVCMVPDAAQAGRFLS